MNKENIIKALLQIRKHEQEKPKQIKFDQTIDLIINLKNFDLKRDSINLLVTLPHKIKNKKVAGFLEKKSQVIDTITREEFDLFKEKKKLKHLIKEYDFFIANAKLMPAVATSFGRALGPSGKMPSPQMGVLIKEEDNAIKNLVEKISSVVKVRAKDPSIKIAIGKLSGKDEEIAENILTVYNEVLKAVTKEKIKSVLTKSTMGKPEKIGI